MTAPAGGPTIFSTMVDVSSQSSFQASADVDLSKIAHPIPARPFVRWLLMLEHPSAVVDVSFDGTTVHHTLTGGYTSAGVKLEQAFQTLWVRCAATGTAVYLRVTAEAPR